MLAQERIPFWQVIADIMRFILAIFKPIVTPIGEVMVIVIDFLLRFFPSENITLYVIIFCILIGAGIFINIKWPGEKYVRVFKKEDEGGSDAENKSSIEHLDQKKKKSDRSEDANKDSSEDENEYDEPLLD